MLNAEMIFGNNMVLQRQKEIKIWGTGLSGKKIIGKLTGKQTIEAETITENDGRWMLVFPPQEACRGLKLDITDGSETLEYRNISIGEIWLAGGQSNMEYFLHYDADKEEILNGPMNADIRFFDYPELSYEGQHQEHDYSKLGIWRKCTKEDLPYFSAVGYYFAKDLQDDLNVPIGIVGCNWGGTPACAWIDPDYLKDNEGKAWLESYAEKIKGLDIESYKAAFRVNPLNDHSDPLKAQEGLAGKTMYPGLSHEEQMELIRMFSNTEMDSPVVGPYSEGCPGNLYKTMLQKVAPYTIRGVIWYQGESDDEKAELYGTVFRKLIECWRKLWNDQLPFLFVQLAPFERWLTCQGDRYPELRKQQKFVSKTVPDVWMISSSDAGMQWDIHPKHKKLIGNRLALLARGHVYGENLPCDPPEFLSAKRVHGGIQISFLFTNGLHVKGDQVNALNMIAPDGSKIQPEKVSIISDELLIEGEFPEKTRITFAGTAYYDVNLYNSSENPMEPFEICI